MQHCFICRPSDSTVQTDARIEPRTVATYALAVRRSNHYARSHPEIINKQNKARENKFEIPSRNQAWNFVAVLSPSKIFDFLKRELFIHAKFKKIELSRIMDQGLQNRYLPVDLAARARPCTACTRLFRLIKTQNHKTESSKQRYIILHFLCAVE